MMSRPLHRPSSILRSLIIVVAALALCLGAACSDDGPVDADPDTYSPGGQCWSGPVQDYVMPPEDDDRPWILVDLVHTHIQTPTDHCLHRDQYAYQGTYGFFRLFDHLFTHDYPWAPTTEELSGPRLEPYEILFINLVHHDNPDFTDDEVDAIIEFVDNGGGLFVITDHSNVYYHATRVNRFLEPMGLPMMYHTAVDQPPRYSVSGRGWIMMFDFADHPVNEGVDMFSFKTGGPIEPDNPDDGLVFSSDQSFADYWDESNAPGFYGNWSQGDDEELEPSGPLPVVAGTEYGEGRVLVVADQNVFGDAWLYAGNNLELALNGFEWLAGNEDTDTPLRDTAPRGHTIVFPSDAGYYQPIRNERPGHGYYVMNIETNRNPNITGRATPDIDLRHAETLFFTGTEMTWSGSSNEDLNDRPYSDQELQDTRQFLEDGGQVVVTFDPRDIGHPTQQLLGELAPDLTIGSGDQTWEVGSEDFLTIDSNEGEFRGFFPATSSFFDVDDLYLGALPTGQFPPHTDQEYDEIREELQERWDMEDPDISDERIYREMIDRYEREQFMAGGSREDVGAYILDLDVDWGEPFLEADVGDHSAPIAQRKLVGDGELIIFVQDGFLRNRTLGFNELLRPKSVFRYGSIEMYHRFLEYLRLQGEDEEQ